MRFYFKSLLFILFIAFFKSYANIRNSKNTNVLLKNILNTWQQVNNDIKFNIYCFAFVFLLVIGEEGQMIILLVTVIFLVDLGILFILLMKAYEKLLYKTLLKKININYEELNRLEVDED